MSGLKTGSFTDPRDGHTYKTVRVGNKEWLAENFAYNCEGSLAYGDDESNVKEFGRLYTKTAMKKAAPDGWRIPTNEDFSELSRLCDTAIDAPNAGCKFNREYSNESGKYGKEYSRCFWSSSACGDGDRYGRYNKCCNFIYFDEPWCYEDDVFAFSILLVRDLNEKVEQPALPTVVAKDKKHLIEIMQQTMAEYGTDCDLNHIDVSNITDMSNLFSGSTFHGDISKWNVSNVTNMSGMFKASSFNGDISQWNVSNVTDMSDMFCRSKFNGDISKWNVSKVENMKGMFMESAFTGDISKWDVSNVTDMSAIFHHSQFNGDISKWNVSNVKKMSQMFYYSQFNGDISQWNVSNVKNMSNMFSNSKFNGDISKWNVSNVENMEGMFQESVFNGDISQWDVSNVTNMVRMFMGKENSCAPMPGLKIPPRPPINTPFNGDLSKWNVSKVKNMKEMFEFSTVKESNKIPEWYKD